jgi:hypothetical protein
MAGLVSSRLVYNKTLPTGFCWTSVSTFIASEKKKKIEHLKIIKDKTVHTNITPIHNISYSFTPKGSTSGS